MRQYRINPSDISTIRDTVNRSSTETSDFILIAVIVGIIWAIVNYFNGGGGWVIPFVIAFIVYFFNKNWNEADSNKFKTIQAQKESEYFTDNLNAILDKSEEIPSKILPYLEASAKKHIDIAKNDFSDNAISPFWDNIEEACKFLALYKEAIDQLQLNGELYSKILIGKSHNFPDRFPIGTNISISNGLLDEYNAIIRKAHIRPEFGNIWEQRKTQKILIAGFQNLGQAINNMKEEINSALGSLEYSIQSGFRELKNIQLEQLRTFETSQAVLNKTLTTMDKKLYYIQYSEKPNRPFIRPPGNM